MNTNFASTGTVLFADCPDILSIEQLQVALDVGRSTAYKLIRNNEIGYLRIGTAIKIPKTALISYIEEHLEVCYDKRCSGQVNRAVRKEIV